MSDLVAVRRALLSVWDKTGLVEFAAGLAGLNVEIWSTGGTARTLRQAGLEVVDVADRTGFPEMLGGRVKTLHPSIHGGLLARRGHEGDAADVAARGLDLIDLAVVNLYPFADAVAAGAAPADCIEMIDIGGPAMVRSAAKNFDRVAVVVEPEDYGPVLDELRRQGGSLRGTRARLAGRAFAHTAAYDTAVADWISGGNARLLDAAMTIGGGRLLAMRYGENPHQKAALYRALDDRPGVAAARQAAGKPLSYNNVADTDAAFELVAQFDRPAAVIVKHATPCGVAEQDDPAAALALAIAADPESAFGGIVALNRPLGTACADRIAGSFFEVVIAPGLEAGALEALAGKPDLRVLDAGGLPPPTRPGYVARTVAGGVLVQSRDHRPTGPEDLEPVTRATPTDAEWLDLLFAERVVGHVRSNAIVIAGGGRSLGIGGGQTSRVEAARQAAARAAAAIRAGAAAVAASDAFFPFPDGLEVLIEAGVRAVIQPGGSRRDAAVIDAADRAGIAMVFTGLRRFRH